jgi:hypothetical protein
MIAQTRLGVGLRTIGWWTPQRDQVDPTIPYLPLEDPAGGSGVTGTGALLAQAATMAGVGITASLSTDGAISAQAAALAGVGLSTSLSTDGAIASQVATLAGVGLSASSGTGALVAQLAALAGSGLSLSTGTGILLAAVATLAGVGLVETIAGIYDWRNRRHRRQVYLMKKRNTR